MTRGRCSSGVRTAVLAAFLAACGGGGETPPGDAPAAAGELAPDRPHLARGTATVTERLVLSDDRLRRPLDVAADGAGAIYVLDEGERPEILKYDSTGAFLLRFGVRDTVRERILAATEIDLAPWNTVLLADRGDNSVKSFLGGGLLASVVPIREGVVLDVHALPEFGEFYLHKWVPEQRRSAILHMRSPGDSLAATYTVHIPGGLSVREEARAIHFHSATDRRGRLYVGFLDGYPIRVLSPQGTTLASIGIEREPIARAPEDLERETEENLARLRRELPDVDEGLLQEAARPDPVLPLIEELAIDPQGRLWVRTNRPDAGDVTPYDVFAADGAYLARVDVPGDVARTSFSPSGMMWVVEKRGDAPRVVGYRVDVPGR